MLEDRCWNYGISVTDEEVFGLAMILQWIPIDGWFSVDFFCAGSLPTARGGRPWELVNVPIRLQMNYNDQEK